MELLAPAGNFESLMAAINAGADSVYLGIGEINMRASATTNFQLSDLKSIAKIAHKNMVKVYVTLNTVVYDSEIIEIKKILKEIKKQKIDGVIASDMAVIKLAKDLGIEVHISTQLSISNIEAVKFYSQFADRIVLARELNLEQIEKIIKDIKKLKIKGPKGKLVEIEVFAHGAMCVAQSGRCFMSLFHNNLSANKGKCVQICRRKYRVIDENTGEEMIIDNNFVMSRSDLCTIGMLDKLAKIGVSVLKIEGRGRGPEYVDTVIKTYKKAIEAIENGTYNQKNVDLWQTELKKVFNRGFSEGYYMGRKLNEWSKSENNLATEKKILSGKVEHFYPKIGIVSIKLDKDKTLKNGDNFMITGTTTGVVRGKIESLKIDDLPTFKVEKKVRVNDKFFIIK
jgi:U32 family peptidase